MHGVSLIRLKACRSSVTDHPSGSSALISGLPDLDVQA